MRKWLFIFVLAEFVYLLIVDPLTSLVLVPSLFLLYWLWRDGEEIEDLRQEIEYLRDVKTEKSQ